jgi:hypothetical protein
MAGATPSDGARNDPTGVIQTTAARYFPAALPALPWEDAEVDAREETAVNEQPFPALAMDPFGVNDDLGGLLWAPFSPVKPLTSATGQGPIAKKCLFATLWFLSTVAVGLSNSPDSLSKRH